MTDIGVPREALQRFIEEQIYTLPGTSRHRERFTVLLTGSRATGHHRDTSDVDIDVLCPRRTYASVQRASRRAGLIRSPTAFFRVLKDKSARRYFGDALPSPHFSLTPLEEVRRQYRQFEDVPLWIWTHAVVLSDPRRQFQRIRNGFRGYPRKVLVRKIKYHWLAAGYWAIDGFPHGSPRGDNVLSAAMAILNSVNELLRFFFLVEGRPYPYQEKLLAAADSTRLGRRFCPLIRDAAAVVTGCTEPGADVWTRLTGVFTRLWCSDQSRDARDLDTACSRAMIAAGVDREWVKADYENIDELLQGRLGPFPT